MVNGEQARRHLAAGSDAQVWQPWDSPPDPAGVQDAVRSRRAFRSASTKWRRWSNGTACACCAARNGKAAPLHARNLGATAKTPETLQRPQLVFS